jgi:hypothetical protein
MAAERDLNMRRRPGTWLLKQASVADAAPFRRTTHQTNESMHARPFEAVITLFSDAHPFSYAERCGNVIACSPPLQ